MNNQHRYILEPYKTPSSRYTCPACGKQKQFTRYINTQTNEHLATHVGKCNREVNCTYHYTPKQYFQDHTPLCAPARATARGAGGVSFGSTAFSPSPLERVGVRSIPLQTFQKSLSHYSQNNFILFLTNLFGDEITSTLISKYFIGTSKHWNGATVFWQIDTQGKIRTGKIMLYNPQTGKRVKHPYNHITWAHTLLNKTPLCATAIAKARGVGGVSLTPSPLERAGVRTCLFGEHLLKDTTIPIAIVESEKTAIIASVYFPDYLWLACGSLTNLTYQRCKILEGRKVILYPDLKCFEKWNTKAAELSSQIPNTNFSVSDYLEKNATESTIKSGLDLADYLIIFNHNQFVTLSEVEVQAVVVGTKWNSTITELESFLTSTPLPPAIQLNNHTLIIDVPKFIDAHLATIKSNPHNRIFEPYLNRLIELKTILINHLL